MNKVILGLDLGSNSLGWALINEEDGVANKIINLGSRIFTKAVEEKTPTPTNVKRRNMRLGRRVLQRRARRKQRMLNYLVSLNLLPPDLPNHHQPEIILNKLGNPYALRAKALDEQLSPFELGRVLLHFVARRGFLSTKKQIAGDLVDDPDTILYLNAQDEKPTKDKEETLFKADIKLLRENIIKNKARTLGEYLFMQDKHQCKRNRNHDGGHLRTDRQMYKDELDLIWEKQKAFFKDLPKDFMTDKKGIKNIIFYQRPLKLKKDRIGKCTLETNKNRAPMSRLEVQQFRYFQDINNLQYFERYTNQWLTIKEEDKKALTHYFEHHPKITLTAIKEILGLDRKTKINLETKNLKGNITACEVRQVIGDVWDNYNNSQQLNLVEDLITIKTKSALKNRLINHWKLTKNQAIQLCLVELEPSHSNLSLKAINKLLPYLKQGLIYSKNDKETGEIGAIQAAGYDNDEKNKPKIEQQNKLQTPPETSNPIVNRGLQELKRVINAITKEYGKPDIIRIEMARDLEMNTTRYKENEARQLKNKKQNEEATEAYKKLNLGHYPNHNDKIKYRLWLEQDKRCAYSNKTIPLNDVFTASVEIDHILPFKKSLDDSYMNKVLCYTAENRNKGAKTPKDAWSGNEEKWSQITSSISQWKGVDAKVKRFYQTEKDLLKRDFISTQLNDTRYIAKLAIEYVAQLVGKNNVTVTKGMVVAKLRHQWGLNDLIGELNKKDRTDHRHHAIDAIVIATTTRQLYKNAVSQIKNNKLNIQPPYENLRDDLKIQLEQLIVSHASKRKLTGGLHEETGAGYVKKHGGLVYRKTLNPGFTLKQVKSIVDKTVQELVVTHLNQYGNNPKKAFADNVTLYHKDGKTKISRVRILQSKLRTTKNQTAEDILKTNKFGIKNKQGNIFKYMAYGNMHHVEIIENKKTGQIKGKFITMMQASHRAKGIKSHLNSTGEKQPIVNTTHGDDWVLKMALHINDLVSVKSNEDTIYYRVQFIDVQNNKIVLRVHNAATLKNKNESLNVSINKENFKKWKIVLHEINAIGVIKHD